MSKSRLKRTFFYESGQALVLVLLSLSVVLTIVLFVLSRSVTDISTSTDQASSVRAFSAAEAGVETALITGIGTNGDINIGDASYSVDVSDYSKGTTEFNYPSKLLSGDTMVLWFTDHDGDGNPVCDATHDCFTGNTLHVCWGNPDTSGSSPTTPAVEISVYYETTPNSAATARIARAAIDPNSGRISANSFEGSDSGTCQIGGVNYSFQKTITLSNLGIASTGVPGTLRFAKIRMLYNTDAGHFVGVSTDSQLPSQGLEIVSTGSAGSGESVSNRRVSVFQGWAEFPFSGFSIFYPSGIVK